MSELLRDGVGNCVHRSSGRQRLGVVGDKRCVVDCGLSTITVTALGSELINVGDCLSSDLDACSDDTVAPERGGSVHAFNFGLRAWGNSSVAYVEERTSKL